MIQADWITSSLSKQTTQDADFSTQLHEIKYTFQLQKQEIEPNFK